MKLLLIAVIISLSCILIQAQKYTSRYDTMNLDEVLKNKRLLNAYIRCVLDQGKCTAEGRELKSHISDALQSGCAKCTSAQRSGMRKVITHLIKNERTSWGQLANKYDPDRTYARRYEKELSSIY